MPHYVYILQSQTSEKYYCGETQNIQDRLNRHNSGLSKSTKYGVPWKLLKLIEVTDRSEARKLESKIKKIGIGRWLEL